MKRAAHRAYRRLKGAHPRRPKSRTSALAEAGCDLLLGVSLLGMLAGISVLAWSIFTGPHLAPVAAGVCLIGLGAVLLLVWERVAWEPFAKDISDHLAELS